MSDGRSVAVPLLAWHRHCCVAMVGWTHECMSMHVHMDIMRMLCHWVGDGEGEGGGV